MDDVELVARARGGDDDAFAQLVRRHTDTVWRFARPLLGDDATAEEVVQDTFLKAYRGLGRFRGDSSVTTWLHTICHRTASDRRRRRRLAVVPLDEAAHVSATTASVDDRLALERALAELNEDERLAFTLVGILGHSHDEAGAVAGAPASTMRTRYARARARLAVALQHDEQGDPR